MTGRVINEGPWMQRAGADNIRESLDLTESKDTFGSIYPQFRPRRPAGWPPDRDAPGRHPGS